VEVDFTININELVEVKALGIRFGCRGRVVNRFAGPGIRQLYAVQFLDNCVGYFERWELEKVLLEEVAPEREKDASFVSGLP